MAANPLKLICLTGVFSLAVVCADDRDGVVSRILEYGNAKVDLRQEAKRLSISNAVKHRITAVGIIMEYPAGFDRATVVSVLVRLLADESEMVRDDALDTVERLLNLPPDVEVGKAETLRLLDSAVERVVKSGGPLHDAAADVLRALRHKTKDGRAIPESIDTH